MRGILTIGNGRCSFGSPRAGVVPLGAVCRSQTFGHVRRFPYCTTKWRKFETSAGKAKPRMKIWLCYTKQEEWFISYWTIMDIIVIWYDDGDWIHILENWYFVGMHGTANPIVIMNCCNWRGLPCLQLSAGKLSGWSAVLIHPGLEAEHDRTGYG